MSSASAGLGVVVVNYGSSVLLERHLTTLDTAAVPATVVVVDNFSTTGEQDAVAALCARHGWDMVASPTNRGFGEACNLGAERAMAHGCDVLVMLNPDAVLSSAAAAALADRCRRFPDSLVSPVIHRSDGAVWFAGSRLDTRSGRVGRARGTFRSGQDTWLTGACLATTSDWWRRLGGFSGDYFLYWEDVDISRRCVDAGGTLIVAEDIVAVHDAGGTQTSSGRGKSAVYYRWNCRNRLLFAARHLPTSALVSWIVRTPKESAAIMLRGGRRQFVIDPSLMVAGLVGTLSGLGLAIRELTRRAWTGIRRGATVQPGTGDDHRTTGSGTTRTDAA